MKIRPVALALAALLGAGVVAGTALGATPTLRSPGKVRPAPKKVATQPPTAPPPVELSANGEHPDVIVDAAGTAHIVWNEPVADGPDVTVYCRLPRAAKACDITQRLVPPGADALADDADGPQVSAVNDQVTILSHRFPQPVPKPGGDPATEDTTLYLWTSDDGGANFVGPGVVGTATIGGEAKAFGPGDNPSIGTVTGQATGGIRFTGLTSGRFVPAAADLAVGGFTDGRMTVVNGIPTVAYHDLGSTSYVQTWTGQGDVNDPATWSAPQTFPGLQPEISSAAGRLVAVDQKPDGSGDLELRDLASGLARTISTGGAGARAVPIGHSDGTVSVVWQGAEGLVRGLWQRDRIGPTGPIRGTPTLLSTEEGAFLSADSADDGGGVAVRDTLDKRILLTAFGNTLPTGVRGLGGAPGGGAPPADVAVDCQKIQLGRATQVLLPPGPCFLNGAKGGLKVSQGPLKLNGMEIVPDAGVQLQIDLNAKTIRSTGTATVLLRAPGVPDITLFRGRIDLSAAGKGAGAVLGQFGEKLFKPDLLGFPLKGDIDLKLAPPDGLRIPVSLELPKELGNIRGSAELLLDNNHGLVARLARLLRRRGAARAGDHAQAPGPVPGPGRNHGRLLPRSAELGRAGPAQRVGRRLRAAAATAEDRPRCVRLDSFRPAGRLPRGHLPGGHPLPRHRALPRSQPDVAGRRAAALAEARPRGRPVQDRGGRRRARRLGRTDGGRAQRHAVEPPGAPGPRHLHRRRPADRDRAGHGDDRRLRQPLARERARSSAR